MSDTGITLLTTLVSTVLSSGLVSAVITQVLKRMDAKDQDKKTAKEADKLLLLDLLKRTAQDHIDTGMISHEDFEIFEETYKCYKACDGDGWADAVLEEVKKLPKIELKKSQNV